MAANFKPLSEQVVVLTGACGPIGLCTAQMASVLGARLVLVTRGAHLLDKFVATVESSGGQAIQVAADVAVRQEARAVAQAAVSRFGRIDTWINNAGLSIYGRLDQVSEAESRHVFDVNFWGVVNGSLAALPHLSACRGSLINVGSVVRDGLTPLQGMYASSKQAVKGFTDALRLEIEGLDGTPVTITLIQPAEVDVHADVDPMRVAQAILKAASRWDYAPRGHASGTTGEHGLGELAYGLPVQRPSAP